MESCFDVGIERTTVAVVLVSILVTFAVTYVGLTYVLGDVKETVKYVFIETFEISSASLSGSINVTAVRFEVGFPVNVSLYLANSLNSSVSGYLSVSIESGNVTIASLVNSMLVIVNGHSSFRGSWLWIPSTVGNYTARGVFKV